MYGGSIGQQDNTQIPSVHFCNRRPPSDAPISLHKLSRWMINHSLNPVQFNKGTVGASSHYVKVFGESHVINYRLNYRPVK